VTRFLNSNCSVDRSKTVLACGVDSALIARLYGRKSSPLAAPISSEAARLLHYADVVLGTDKKERFSPSEVKKVLEK
jgi:hypothetical protein